MGTLIGHVAPGCGFLLIGLWHLYNNIMFFSLNPNGFRSHTWFPFPKLRHLELLFIAIGGSTYISTELFLGPSHHQPLDPADFTIPSSHLHNFEHSSITLAFILYAALAAALERYARPAAARPLTMLAAASAFGQELLLFHLHSTDHMGLEGQYHWLLQLLIAVSLVTTLMGIGRPCSFVVAFVRSASITFQGLWFIILGYALWTPALIPKGCFMHDEDGHFVVRCRSDEDLHRAKSLANILFSCVITTSVGCSFLSYFLLSKRYHKDSAYDSIQQEEDPFEDLELLKKINSSKLEGL